MKFEKELGEIVNKVNEEIKHFEEQRKGLGNVVLLIGKTGSGKSTLFNFLIGANFKAKQGTKRFELDLQLDSDKFSLMKSGCQSVTKFPKCFYEENYKHLVVDFPGFSDTNGWIDEVVIQSLFNKITQKSNLKIVLVNYQPEDDFPNRGVDLQEFLKSVIDCETVKLEKITLLMNQYSGETNEEDLISDWQNDIQDNLQQNAGKIIIQKAVRYQEDLQYLSKEQRDLIWRQLVQTPVVQLQPYQFKNRDIITSYLTESINLVLLKTVQELDNCLSTQQLTTDQIGQLNQQYTLIKQLLKSTTIHSVIAWIDSYLAIIQEIKNILKFQSKLKFNQALFVQIYTFFLDFSNQIDGYNQVKQTIEKIVKNCQTTISNLTKKREEILKLQEAERQKKEAERLKQEAEKQRQEAEKKKQEAERQRLEAERQRLEAERKEQLAKQQAEQERKDAEERARRLQEQQQEQMRQYRLEQEAREREYARQERIYEQKIRREQEEANRRQREAQQREQEIRDQQQKKEREEKEKQRKQLEEKTQREKEAKQLLQKQEEQRLEKEKQEKEEQDKKAKELLIQKQQAEESRRQEEQRRQQAEEAAKREEARRIEAERKAKESEWGLFTPLKKVGQVAYGLGKTAVGVTSSLVYVPLALATGNQTLKEVAEISCQITSGGISNIGEGLNPFK